MPRKTTLNKSKENIETNEESMTKETNSSKTKMYEFKINTDAVKKTMIKNSLPIKFGESSGFVPAVDPKYQFNSFINDIIEDIKEDQRVCLVGHTGCGKTSGIEQVAARINQPVIRVNLNGQLTVGDFVGMWTVKAGETVWVDGVLPLAMTKGYWLILDELDMGDTPILSLLNPVLEKNGKLVLKEKGHEVVQPHKDFRIFATGNTIGCMQAFRHLYQGTNILNEAFLDRFRIYLVDYMKQDQERDMLISLFKEKYTSKADLESDVLEKNFKRTEGDITALTTQMVKIANAVRESFQKGDTEDCTFSTRRLIDWMEMTVRHENPLKAANNCIFSKISAHSREVIEGVMKRELPDQKKITAMFGRLQGSSAMTPEEEGDELFKIAVEMRKQMLISKGKSESEVEEDLNKKSAKEATEALINSYVGFASDIRALESKKEISYSLNSEVIINFFKENVNMKIKKEVENVNEIPFVVADKIIKPHCSRADFAKITSVIDKRLIPPSK